jgi:hypothetical protein
MTITMPQVPVNQENQARYAEAVKNLKRTLEDLINHPKNHQLLLNDIANVRMES